MCNVLSRYAVHLGSLGLRSALGIVQPGPPIGFRRQAVLLDERYAANFLALLKLAAFILLAKRGR